MNFLRTLGVFLAMLGIPALVVGGLIWNANIVLIVAGLAVIAWMLYALWMFAAAIVYALWGDW